MNARQIVLDGRIRDSKGRQFVTGQGHYGDGFSEILRIQQWGYASVPVPGSRGIIIPLGGNEDQAVFIGGDHGGHTPADLPGGASAIYDASGNIIKLVGGGGLVIDVASRTVTITAGEWTLNGNATINGNLHVTGNITTDGTNPNHHSH